MTTDSNSLLKRMAAEVNSVIHAEKSRGRFNMLIWLGLAVIAVLVLVWWLRPQDSSVQWQTHTLDRADMELTAMATGNLQPKSEVSVGAEISGLINEVLVSENDEIQEGQVLARFDTEELDVALQQASAGLALARATVAEANATLDEAVIDERRMETLSSDGRVAKATLDSAIASRKRGQARLAHANASVQQAQASVSQARTRLEKAVITSPINGVVLQRSIEPGATVAASFQTPVLFLLAEDLREMELHVSMDEADVGMVKAGQSATFTVDAWSGQQFDAEVTKVYLYPTVENNVVTYTTVMAVDNPDLLLQPGMTATATIVTGERKQALRAPNSAFRFTPPEAQGEGGGGLFGAMGASRDRPTGASNTIWVLEGDQPKRILVRTGPTDGRYTQIISEELAEGDEILTGVVRGRVE